MTQKDFDLIPRKEYRKRYRKWLSKYIDVIQELQKIPYENKISWGTLVEQNAEQYAENLAVMDDKTTLTYAEFNSWVNRYAHYFNSIGVKKGETIQLMLKNRLEYPIIFSAAGKIGAVLSLINSDTRKQSLIHSLNLTPAKYTIIDGDLLPAYDEIKKALNLPHLHKLLILPENEEELVPQDFINLSVVVKDMSISNPSTTSQIKTKDPLAYLFTSGTTGLPKATVLIHYRMVGSYYYHGKTVLEVTPNDIMYICLPFFHGNALTSAWSPTFGGGGSIAISHKFSVHNFWNEIRAFDTTMFIYVGEICRYLLNQDPSTVDRDHSIRAIIGNGLRPEIWHEFKNRFGIEKIFEFYGASETSSIFINLFNFDKTIGFCGENYAIIKYDIENDKPIKNENGKFVKVKTGGVGLLLFDMRTERTFVGYTQKEATNKKIFRNVFKEGDKWFNTGDLVRDQGCNHIQFIDRLGDTYRWKGHNVSTTEVENIINGFDQISVSCSYGVQIPGTEGKAGMVSVVPSVDSEVFDITRLTDYLRKNMAPYAIPIFLRIKEEFETTSTFRLKKSDLKKEGFNIEMIKDQVFILLSGKDEFLPLNKEIHEKLLNREFRF